jgi:hypothetical protein
MLNAPDDFSRRFVLGWGGRDAAGCCAYTDDNQMLIRLEGRHNKLVRIQPFGRMKRPSPGDSSR